MRGRDDSREGATSLYANLCVNIQIENQAHEATEVQVYEGVGESC